MLILAGKTQVLNTIYCTYQSVFEYNWMLNKRRWNHLSLSVAGLKICTPTIWMSNWMNKNSLPIQLSWTSLFKADSVGFGSLLESSSRQHPPFAGEEITWWIRSGHSYSYFRAFKLLIFSVLFTGRELFRRLLLSNSWILVK